MKYVFLLIPMLFCSSLFEIKAQNGSLDSTFGSGGFLGLTAGHTGDWERLQMIVPYNNDRFLLAGEAEISSGQQDLFLMMIDSTGKVDSSFGTNGRVFINYSNAGTDEFRDLVVTPDSSIFVLGANTTHPTYGTFPTVSKLRPNGTFDTRFNSTGLWSTAGGAATPTLEQGFNQLIVSPDGTLQLFGYAGGGSSDDVGIYATLSADGINFSGFGAFSNYVQNGRDMRIIHALQAPDGSIYTVTSRDVYHSVYIHRLLADQNTPGTYNFYVNYPPKGVPVFNNGNTETSGQNGIGYMYEALLASNGLLFFPGFKANAGFTAISGQIATMDPVAQTHFRRDFNIIFGTDRIMDIIELADSSFLVSGFTIISGITTPFISQITYDTSTNIPSISSNFGVKDTAWMGRDSRMDNMIVLPSGNIFQYGYGEDSDGNDTILIAKFRNDIKQMEPEPQPKASIEEIRALDATGTIGIDFLIESGTGGGTVEGQYVLEASASVDFSSIAFTDTIADTTVADGTIINTTVATGLNLDDNVFFRITAQKEAYSDLNETYYAVHYYDDSIPQEGIQLWAKANKGVVNQSNSLRVKNMACGEYFLQPFVGTSRITHLDNSSPIPPAIVNNMVNGLPVIRFDSTNRQYMKSDKRIDLTQGYSIFWVGRSNAQKERQGILKIDNVPNGLSAALDINWRDNGPNVTGSLTVITGRSSSGLNYENSAVLDSTGPAINTTYYLASVATNSGNTIEMSLKDFPTAVRQLPGTFLNNVDALPNLEEFLFLGIGTGISSGIEDSYLHGDIAEIIIYNRELDSLETKQVEDYLDRKYFMPTSIKEIEARNEKSILYPNPTTGNLFLERESKGAAKVSILSLNGQVLDVTESKEPQLMLNTRKLAPGMYLVKIQTEQGVESLPFIKQ